MEKWSQTPFLFIPLFYVTFQVSYSASYRSLEKCIISKLAPLTHSFTAHIVFHHKENTQLAASLTHQHTATSHSGRKCSTHRKTYSLPADCRFCGGLSIFFHCVMLRCVDVSVMLLAVYFPYGEKQYEL